MINKRIFNDIVVDTLQGARYRWTILALVLGVAVMTGCSGMQAFSHSIYPGDTLALAIKRHDVDKKDATIVVTDSNNVSQSFPGDDPRVRGWVNAYVDPVSKIVVGRETSQNLGVSATTFGLGIENHTGLEKDWYETVLYIDSPTDLSPGVATFDVEVAGASILLTPVSVNVLAGTGAPHAFEIWENGNNEPLRVDQWESMERAKHFTVKFSGTDVPEAIQVDFSHDPDRENGGAGQAYVVNPRGDKKNIAWTDDGTNLRVIITTAWYKTVEDYNAEFVNSNRFEWFKFYVAGDITGLQVAGVSAFGLNGETVTGVSAQIQ